MSPRPVSSRLVGDAIHVDEVGLAFGVYRDLRLHGMATPVFARGAGGLVPVAAEGFSQPWLNGRPVGLPDFEDGVPEWDRPFVARLEQALTLRNAGNLGLAGLDLLFRCGSAAAFDVDGLLADLRLIDRFPRETGAGPRRLVCVVPGWEPADPAVLGPLAAELRALGVCLAVDGVGSGLAGLDHVRLLRPELVAVDGAWFRQIAARHAALGLFAALVRMLHGQGAAVLVRGIDDPDLLSVALDCGADLFQGEALASPARVGTAMDDRPVPLPEAGASGRKVVPLAVRAATHQPR